MRINELIIKTADRMNHEHSDKVIYQLDFAGKESQARMGAMGFTISVLKRKNRINANWYSFQNIFDHLLFIVLYPVSVLFCCASHTLRTSLNSIIGYTRQ